MAPSSASPWVSRSCQKNPCACWAFYSAVWNVDCILREKYCRSSQANCVCCRVPVARLGWAAGTLSMGNKVSTGGVLQQLCVCVCPQRGFPWQLMKRGEVGLITECRPPVPYQRVDKRETVNFSQLCIHFFRISRQARHCCKTSVLNGLTPALK